MRECEAWRFPASCQPNPLTMPSASGASVHPIPLAISLPQVISSLARCTRLSTFPSDSLKLIKEVRAWRVGWRRKIWRNTPAILLIQLRFARSGLSGITIARCSGEMAPSTPFWTIRLKVFCTIRVAQTWAILAISTLSAWSCWQSNGEVR